MRTWAIVGGEARRVGSVDRGEPLLHSPQGWFDTYYRWILVRWKSSAKRVLAMLAILVPSLWFLGEPILAVICLVGAPIAVVLSLLLSRRSAKRSFMASGFVPGLYTHGLQLPFENSWVNLFFPYAEMGYVRQSTVRGSTSVEVGYHGGRRRVTVDGGFLGVDGLALLRSHAGRVQAPGPEAPPPNVAPPEPDR